MRASILVGWLLLPVASLALAQTPRSAAPGAATQRMLDSGRDICVNRVTGGVN